MSDQVLTVLKFCLLAALYLFLARIVWTVAHELRGTAAPVVPTVAPAMRAAAAPRTKRREWQFVTVAPETEAGQAYAIDGEATIGRGGGCTIALPLDTFVSQVHARAYQRDGGLWIEDLQSTNGTHVNGTRIDKATKLRKGDHVQIGDTVLEVER
ncbi:MAG TPA: FHA domain-containing protein [Acidimicrobiia bacterium]|nr:FHA domain-containing protein [Acidimicrobiia bacterium]